MTLEQTYGLADVATALGCSQRFIRDRIKAGGVSHLRIGDGPNAQIRFTTADVEALKATLRPVELPKGRRRRGRAA